jgi:P4 family phage/plasmid primase-like protien
VTAQLDDSPPWEVAPSFSAVSLAKLTASALTEEYVRSVGVLPVNDQRDLPPEFADNIGLCTVPGMLFPWRDPRDPEKITWQYRPDNPVEPAYKYVFPEGQHQPLGLIKAGTGDRAAFVEGTLQGLAFSRYAPEDVPVYAIPGCDGWSKNKNATEQLTVVEGKDVVIFLDADAGTNASVYDAGYELARFSKIYGATGAFFARAPGRGVNGIDDFLGSAAEDKRAGLLVRMLDTPELKPAPRKPPGKPKAKSVYGLATAEGLPDANDTALGTQWADASLMNYRWLTDDESWLACREGRWERVGSSVPASSVMKFLNFVSGQYLAAAATKDGDQREKLEETGRNLLSSAKRTSVRMTASDYDATHVRRAELDQHPTLWCAANGVLDLETGEVVEHNPDLLLTTGSPVPYVPGATCPRFDAFLAEVQPDEAVREYLLRVFAMAMYGEVREHVLPVMIGEGRNGKGTTNRIMHGVFGSHAEVIESSALLMRKYEKHEEEVARLAGKRLITTEETGRDSVWNVPRINSWTGGDRLKGRWMGGNSFSFNPSHTLVMATNHRPNVGQGERAFWARYREIPFEVDFSDRVDLSLEPWILENELPGVFNRLIEAGRSYRAHGLQEPAAVTMATLDAKVDADNLARFCAEHLAVTHDHELDRIANNELFEVMIKWWSQNVRGEAHPGARTFSKIMRSALGFPSDAKNPKKIGKGTDSKLTWTGIRWLNGGTVEINNGGSAASSETIMNSGRPEVPNPSTPIQPVEDPQNGSAATGPGSAARSAATDDHEDEIVPGQKVVSARSAESAVKVRSSYTDMGNTENGPVDHGLKSSSQKPGGENGAYRQTEQSAATNGVPSGVVVLDLETGSADQLHTTSDPERFVRLIGHSTGNGVITGTDPRPVIDAVLSSRLVIGSNHVAFDIPALSRIDPRVDVLALAREHRLFDTMIGDSVLNPLVADIRVNAVGMAQKHFKIDKSAERLGVAGKTNSLAELMKKHDCDFDEIPIDDEFRDYLIGDVNATRGVGRVLLHQLRGAPQRVQDYVWREHRVHAIASRMSGAGFLADEELLQYRYWRTAERKNRRTQALIRDFDIPTTKVDGKPADSPASTKGGKAAVQAAFLSLGVSEASLPRTPKGAFATGGEPMKELAASYAAHPNGEAISDLCDMIADINGSRTIYGTALEYLRPDGRVHPQIATFQATGRWSVTKPGLTVFGKRGTNRRGERRVMERAVFRAGEGNVLFTIDLSQVDARAIAVHSQDHSYLELFEPGLDAHEIFGRMVWGDSTYDSDPKLYREQVKAITHGLPYGMQIDKLVSHTGVERAVAEQVLATRRERFPRLLAWEEEVREEARSGRALDNGFGRLMRPDPVRGFTQGTAFKGQGCARDLMMQCLLNVDDFDVKHGTHVIDCLRVQIHDEAIWEVPEHLADSYATVVESCFNFPWAPEPSMRPVQLVAQVDRDKTTGKRKFGRSWSECY